MVTRKQLEISELLRREISSIAVRELNDPRMGFITITRVHVGGDYRTAKVFTTVRGSREEVDRTLDVLTHARGRIQALVADRIKLRNTPVLQFIEDTETTEALRVDRLIDRVRREDDREGEL